MASSHSVEATTVFGCTGRYNSAGRGRRNHQTPTRASGGALRGCRRSLAGSPVHRDEPETQPRRAGHSAPTRTAGSTPALTACAARSVTIAPGHCCAESHEAVEVRLVGGRRIKTHSCRGQTKAVHANAAYEPVPLLFVGMHRPMSVIDDRKQFNTRTERHWRRGYGPVPTRSESPNRPARIRLLMRVARGHTEFTVLPGSVELFRVDD